LIRNATPDLPALRFKDVYRYERVLGNGAFGVVVKVEKIIKGEDDGGGAAVKVSRSSHYLDYP
jgi:hypothetical protein